VIASTKQLLYSSHRLVGAGFQHQYREVS